ncbi:uncharacterized protein LOC115644461 [Gopherus evgoodei]|uniref:uncharacterized protein LOC115644461 n=1 Tax=Gopherus evgoodei TaxID=1825980 RepID=UPI0011CFD4D5|nr:uncharacterized protein LOC115644461 [Gopherus evgoodei]
MLQRRCCLHRERELSSCCFPSGVFGRGSPALTPPGPAWGVCSGCSGASSAKKPEGSKAVGRSLQKKTEEKRGEKRKAAELDDNRKKEAPHKHLITLGKGREAAKAEEERQNEELLGAGSTGVSREDGMFRKPQSSFAELEKRFSDFSLKSAMLQEVLLGFKAIPMMIHFWETSSAELFEGVASESKGTEAVACGNEGASDLRGGGCVFHQGRVGSAGPLSKSPLQRCHAGEL